MNTLSTPSKNAMYEPGDFIEFKQFASIDNSDIINNKISKGKIIDCSNPDLLEVIPIKKDDNNIIWISPSAITKHYPQSAARHLSIRLLLKEIWKHFIFREVKTIKAKDPYMTSYQYVNNSGFVRSEKYRNLTDAQRKVPYEHKNNIQVHYRDYFGFTTDRTIRNNDIYYNQEIFFSKKCYGELNLNNAHITGEFSYRRGFKTVPPRAKQYICGLVEHGEKGLFYRKWFACSKEFLTLWTMICEPDHYSLKYKKDNTFVTKSLEDILTELDTSHYDTTNTELPVDEQQKRFKVHNIEYQALYIPDLYKKVILAIFNPGSLDNDLYDYPTKIKSDLMWMRDNT